MATFRKCKCEVFLNEMQKKKRNNNKSFKSPNYSNQWWEAGTKGGTKVCDSFRGESADD